MTTHRHLPEANPCNHRSYLWMPQPTNHSSTTMSWYPRFGPCWIRSVEYPCISVEFVSGGVLNPTSVSTNSKVLVDVMPPTASKMKYQHWHLLDRFRFSLVIKVNQIEVTIIIVFTMLSLTKTSIRFDAANVQLWYLQYFHHHRTRESGIQIFQNYYSKSRCPIANNKIRHGRTSNIQWSA